MPVDSWRSYHRAQGARPNVGTTDQTWSYSWGDPTASGHVRAEAFEVQRMMETARMVVSDIATAELHGKSQWWMLRHGWRWLRIGALIILGGALVLAGTIGPYWGVAPGVTPAGIQAIDAGMRPEQVTVILGAPLQVREWGPDAIIFDYARPHLFAPWTSRLWVYFRGGRVDTVQGERVSLLGDKQGVYLLRPYLPRWASGDFDSTYRPWWRARRPGS
jgi:hypothetical protein